MLKDPLMARDVILPKQTLQLQFSNLVLIKYSINIFILIHIRQTGLI